MKRLFSFVILCFLVQTVLAQSKEAIRPFVIGEIRELDSKILGEKRILNIYLPEGYNPNDTIRYPVIYLLDGSADEDFIHVVGLIQFNTFPWIKRVPKSIVVGIANVDRKRDFTFPTTVEKDKTDFPTTGGSEKFIRFLEEELLPFINSNYRTNRARLLIGQSLGGLLATEILFSKPRLFDKYIIISPSLWWDNGSLLKNDPDILKEDFTSPVMVYLGVGQEGQLETDARKLVAKIKKGKNKLLVFHFDYLANEDHAGIAHQAISNALKLLYPIKK